MFFASSGAAGRGGAITVRPLKLLAAVGLATLCFAFLVVAAPGEAAAAPAKGVCVVSRTGAPTPAAARASRIGFLGAAEWLGARAGTALAEKTFLTGIEAIMKAAGHRNPAEKTLERLAEIRGHLDQISAQLGRVEGRLDGIASAVLNTAFANELRPLCAISRAQQKLFDEYYEPLLRAGYRLDAILESSRPQEADEPDADGITPRARVTGLLNRFIAQAKLREDAGDFETLHAALMPSELGGSVLKAYGRVLMGKRTISRADSQRLRALYQELAQVRAVATWMSEEYLSTDPFARAQVIKRRESQLHDGPEEELRLPRMIPPGVVIDLGSSGAERVSGKPMWFPPGDSDLKWLPPTQVGAAYGSIIRNEELDVRLQQVNSPSFDPGAGYGNGWTVPTRKQFEALISDGCVVSRTDPNAFQGPSKCTDAVKAGEGGNVAGYLFRMNEGNGTWRQLFCTSGCSASSGPDAAQFRHTFIWTRDIHTEKMTCGWEAHFFKNFIWSRALHTYTGFRTTTDGPVWHAFPQLLGRPPKRGQTAPEALSICDAWVTKLLKEAPTRNPEEPRQNIEVSGILLATRYAGADDLNPVSDIDFMAQK